MQVCECHKLVVSVEYKINNKQSQNKLTKMLWYVVSIASYLYQKVMVFVNRQAAIAPRSRRRTTNSDSAFSDDVDAPMLRRPRYGRRLKKKMSFASGVDGIGQSIAILTSGGDSQGMNSAIRATVRLALHAGAKTFVVYWGYQGLVDGGKNIKEIFWDGVHGIIHQGGTVIGSARCTDFRERAGRKKAAYNLIKRGITNLVVIGGDGSLTGASLLSSEWKSLVAELKNEGKITEEQAIDHSYLSLVGMVGSIDNDFCGTDMTIGADSALHRVLESVDAIATTAQSHQRAFILEVMGRRCGYLALIAGISCNADWVFLPEWPSEDGWEENLCDNLRKTRETGRVSTIIILAEGAQDVHGNPVTAAQVKELLSKKLKYDTRVTVLGHVQRGGTPSAFDRLLASRLGAEAALCVLESGEQTIPTVMCLNGQQIVKKPLQSCVDSCIEIKTAFDNGEFEKVVKLRGSTFEKNLIMFKELKHVSPPQTPTNKGYKLAVMTIGAPAGGMNAAVRSFVRIALYNGHSVLGVTDSFDGLMNNKFRYLTWSEVEQWTGQGGSNLGVSRTLPEKHLDKIAERLKEHGIQSLLIIGGFEAFDSLVQLTQARKKYDEFCIPMVVIPATMSNNVPGSWFSLGADTALNVIVESCDRLRMSASSSQSRVFIVETMGGRCGYLATMAAIAGGADSAYTFEDKFTLADLKDNITHLIHKFKYSNFGSGLILRTEHCNENYSTDFISRVYSEEGKGIFETRTNVLGHVQQGGTPSPFDRLCGTRQGVKSFNFLLQKMDACKDEFGLVKTEDPNSSCVLGHIKNSSTFTPVLDLLENTDFKNRVPRCYWWTSNIKPLLKVLAHYEVMYYRETDRGDVGSFSS